MRPIPCKDCICLPICKAQVNEYIHTGKFKFTGTGLYQSYKMVLRDRCSIIKEWVASASETCELNICFDAINILFVKYNPEIEVY